MKISSSHITNTDYSCHSTSNCDYVPLKHFSNEFVNLMESNLINFIGCTSSPGSLSNMWSRHWKTELWRDETWIEMINGVFFLTNFLWRATACKHFSASQITLNTSLEALHNPPLSTCSINDWNEISFLLYICSIKRLFFLFVGSSNTRGDTKLTLHFT